MTELTAHLELGLDRAEWADFGAVLDRLNRIDAAQPVRIRRTGGTHRLLAVLPAGVLVGRSSRRPDRSAGPFDLVTTAAGLAGWLAGQSELPAHPDPWLTPVPPESGWQRIDVVPADVIRDLVRQGADAHLDAANRALGARTATALLDLAVLTVRAGAVEVELSNRTLTGLSSMGFLTDDGPVIVSVQGRWTRLATERGSAFVANRADGLRLA